MMSTSELIIQPVAGFRESAPPFSPEPSLTILLKRSINADRHRLFQALTLSEFIEAWFRVPNAAIGSTEVFSDCRSFHIDYRHLCGVRNRFRCSYRVMRRSKIQFTWASDVIPDHHLSLVTLRLHGDFARTSLHLTHAGLGRNEYLWYRALWEGSIERLARLFELQSQ